MALSGSYRHDFASYFWLRLDWTGTQSVSGNYTDVTAKLYFGGRGHTVSSGTRPGSITIDGTKYSLTAPTVQKNRDQTILLFQATKRVYHNADGTKSFTLTASIDLKLTLSGTYYGTVTVPTQRYTLNTIPRASQPSLSASSREFGQSVTIYTNRASSSFTHTLRYAFGSASGTIATGVGTSYSWTIPTNLMNQIPNATSGKITIYCDTYSGSSKIGTKSVQLTATVPSSVVPTFDTISHSEYVSDVASKVGKYVQGLSRLSLAITGAAGVYGSTIKSYQITFEGTNYNSQSATSAVIKGSGDLTITGKVTDSRGRSASKSVTVNVLPYAAPKITTFGLQRCNEDGSDNALGEYVKVISTGSVSSLQNNDEKNSLTYRIKSRPRAGGEWELKHEATISQLVLNGSDILGVYPANESFEFMLEVSDIFYTTFSLNVLPTGIVPLSIGKYGIGVGKIHEKGALDVLGKIYRDGVEIGGVMMNSLETPKDLNDAIGFGVYELGEEHTHMPAGGSFGQLFTMRGQGLTIAQFLASFSADTLFYRLGKLAADSDESDQWGDWITIAGIVESGSNDNGSYVRWSNGLQVCWHYGMRRVKIASAYGSLYQDYRDYTFPVAFSSIPAVSVGPATWNTGASWGSVRETTLTQVSIRYIDVMSRGWQEMPVGYIAIGWWK